MAWQCRLYGHQWRHPGTYEVIITDGDVPAHPVECAICDRQMLMEMHPAGEPERKTTLEAETTPELEADADPPDP